MAENLTAFQQNAAVMGVKKLLNNKTFYLSDLQALAKLLGREAECSGKDFEAMRPLHCVEYGEMGPELARMMRDKCLEILGLPPHTIEAAQRVNEPEPESKAPKLAFWRRNG